MALSFILKNLKFLKLKKPPNCTAVIAAAGVSVRCEGEDKLFFSINDKPVLAYTLEVFENCKLINEVIVVAHKERVDSISKLCSEYGFKKVSKIMSGGSVRSESVMNGIYAASRNTNLIAIHDGARPCLDIETLEKTIIAAGKHGAAAPAVAITSTIKRVENDIISATVDRDGLYEIQTPQIFRTEVIKAALTKVLKKSIDVTDDCMAVEMLGFPVHTVEGSRRNIKITDNQDFHIIEAFLNEED